MTQKTPSYDNYLAALPPDRREAVSTVWGIVRANVRDGFVEEIGETFLQFKAGDAYYVGLANQKNYISLYLMCAYASPELKARLESGGTKLKMGKSCSDYSPAINGGASTDWIPIRCSPNEMMFKAAFSSRSREAAHIGQ